MNDTAPVYVIHTTTVSDWAARALIKKATAETVIAVNGDCFYGWGEKPNSWFCQVHVQIVTTDLEEAITLAQFLYSQEAQVVVTSSENEHESPYSSGHIPINYSATHAH